MFALISNRSELFDFLSQVTSSIFYLLHGLLCRVFRITGYLSNASSSLLGILLDLYRLRESAAHLLKTFAQEALRLFTA